MLPTSIIMTLALISPLPLQPITDNKETITLESSWYGAEFDGKRTASGEIFKKDDPEMAAHKELPFGTTILLRNPETGQEQKVTISDRGPFHGNRDLDVSEAAATNLGFKDKGVTLLEAIVIEP